MTVRIRGIEVDVDIAAELDNYEWRGVKMKEDNMIACSPFRDERHPSFSVHLESGLWIDFGGDDDEWKKGNFVKLIAYLENITYTEAEDLLLDAYGIVVDDVEELHLSMDLKPAEANTRTYSREELKPFLFRYRPYLLRRGITDEIMKKFVVGYDKEQEAVAFFWQDADTGRVVNIKFRKTASKVFYYMPDGQPIKNHVFGLYHVKKDGHKRVFIVESEIDALYLWSNGIPAVALGGSSLSPEQKRAILLSGVEDIIIATDNDKAGFRLRKSIEREMVGNVNIQHLYLPRHAKDVNDLPPIELLKYVDDVKPMALSIFTKYKSKAAGLN